MGAGEWGLWPEQAGTLIEGRPLIDVTHVMTCSSLQVFGEATVRNIHAADWRDREAALGAVSRCVRSGGLPRGTARDPAAIYQAAAELLSRSLK